MRDLRTDLREYIELRRALGYKLRKHEARLREFIAFLETKGIDYITTKLAIRWATESSNGHRYSGFERLSFIRSFATHLSAMDPRTEIPPTGSIRRPPTDLRPYIYTKEEIGRLMAAARKLPSPRKLRCHTYYHLIGLLATTGMRSGEAVRLANSDVNLADGLNRDNARFTELALPDCYPYHDSKGLGRIQGPQGCVPQESRSVIILH